MAPALLLTQAPGATVASAGEIAEKPSIVRCRNGRKRREYRREGPGTQELAGGPRPRCPVSASAAECSQERPESLPAGTET